MTVLSSDDPVRVFERFATLDAVSQGRAEIVAGRGSFTESFPLFGFDLADYEELFERAQDEFGVSRQRVAVHSPGFVAATDEQARETVYEGWLAMRTQVVPLVKDMLG